MKVKRDNAVIITSHFPFFPKIIVIHDKKLIEEGFEDRGRDAFCIRKCYKDKKFAGTMFLHYRHKSMFFAYLMFHEYLHYLVDVLNLPRILDKLIDFR